MFQPTMWLIAAVSVVAVAWFVPRLARGGPDGVLKRLRYVLSVHRLSRRYGFVVPGLEPDLGALTLVEAAKLSQDPLQQGVVETFVLESVVLDRLPFLPIQGGAYKYNEEATLPGVEFRAVNAAYAESTGTVNPKTESLVILGGDSDVDTYIQATQSNLNDQRATQTRMKVKAATFKFQDAFVNGDTAVDANSFDGLKKRLTGAQVVDAAPNGPPVVGTGTSDPDAFFDKLDEAIASVNGDVDALYMNKAIRAKIMSAGRRKGGTEWVMVTFFEETRPKRIPTYNGIPMLDIGTKADGTNIIPLTETQGSVSDASSIYAVRFGDAEGDQAVTGLFNGNNGIGGNRSEDQPFDVRDLGELETKPALRTRIEGFLGLAVFGGKAAARLRGVRNA